MNRSIDLFANQWLFSLAGIGELWTDTIVDVVFTAAVALLLHGVQRRSGSAGEGPRRGSSA